MRVSAKNPILWITKHNKTGVLLTMVAAMALTFNKQGLPERTDFCCDDDALDFNRILIEFPQKEFGEIIN